MKLITSSIILFLAYTTTFACDFWPASFCFTAEEQINNLRVCVNIFAPENIEDNQFQYFPNPADESLTIRTNVKGISGIIELFDPKGQVLLRRQFTSPSLQVPTDHLPQGIYFIRLQIGGIILNNKLLVHHR